MISLETARKLKEAGLRWEPKIGDWYYDEPQDWYYDENSELYVIGDGFDYDCVKSRLEQNEEYPLFAPRLDQLLAEIEKLGYTWDLYRTSTDCVIILNKSHEDSYGDYTKCCDNPEEAAAKALLWILKREKEGNN